MSACLNWLERHHHQQPYPHNVSLQFFNDKRCQKDIQELQVVCKCEEKFSLEDFEVILLLLLSTCWNLELKHIYEQCMSLFPNNNLWTMYAISLSISVAALWSVPCSSSCETKDIGPRKHVAYMSMYTSTMVQKYNGTVDCACRMEVIYTQD